MTKEEIRKFLDNTKVYVNGKSKEIQEKLFSFGYQWINTCYKTVSYTNAPFLYIDNNETLTYGIDMDFFKKNKNKEISTEEILSLEITEPSYRPFRDNKECWQEMLKHQPFGWLTSKNTGAFAVIGAVKCIGNHKVGITWATNESETYMQDDVFNSYTFADGEPFGIKED